MKLRPKLKTWNRLSIRPIKPTTSMFSNYKTKILGNTRNKHERTVKLFRR